MARAESSKDAQSNGTKAQSNGGSANYELPWYIQHKTYSYGVLTVL